MRYQNTKPESGFTLIELLVVISIIGLLAAVALVSLNQARVKARDAKRKGDLTQLQKALELYAANNSGAYPSTGGSWWGVSANGGNRTTSGANAYILGLTPTYLTLLPTDPRGITTDWSGYLYRSDGSNYKLLLHETGPESFPTANQAFYDPVRPTWAWLVCSVGSLACTTW
jgi:type II secretion system protein G